MVIAKVNQNALASAIKQKQADGAIMKCHDCGLRVEHSDLVSARINACLHMAVVGHIMVFSYLAGQAKERGF